MLTKILFTLLVVVGVALYIRASKTPSRKAPTRDMPETESGSAPSTRALVYALIGLLVAVSIGVFLYKWQQDNRIIEIRVTTESGEVAIYRALHKDIDGRRFLSLQGIQVTLGSGDRMETVGH